MKSMNLFAIAFAVVGGFSTAVLGQQMPKCAVRTWSFPVFNAELYLD
jgi:hypothetical protein